MSLVIEFIESIFSFVSCNVLQLLHYRKFYFMFDFRSQIHLRKLGDQITLDAVEGGSKEEDSSINVVSDGDNNINHAGSPWDELQTLDPSMKVPDLNQAAHEELHPHGTSLNSPPKCQMINHGGEHIGA